MYLECLSIDLLYSSALLLILSLPPTLHQTMTKSCSALSSMCMLQPIDRLLLLLHLLWLLLGAIVWLSHACCPLCIPLVVWPCSLQLLQSAAKHLFQGEIWQDANSADGSTACMADKPLMSQRGYHGPQHVRSTSVDNRQVTGCTIMRR